MRTELLAGLVTFSTMSYIICVQPLIMTGQMVGTNTGMDFGALITTTCLASAFGCFLMGLWAKYPLALAPGMGENFVVVGAMLPVCASVLGLNMGDAPVWQLALGAVFISGVLFVLLSLFGVRSALIQIISPSLKSAIGAGIGVFIAYLGLKNGGVIAITGASVASANLSMGNLLTPNVAIFAVGLILSATLMYRNIPGALLISIIVCAILALCMGQISFDKGIVGLPANPMPIVGKLDIVGAFQHLAQLWPLILILTFMDVFDTFGTAVGVAKNAGLMTINEKGEEILPRCERVFGSDAIATIVGAVMGHSTITAFVESASGVQSGGRTGLTACTVGVLFLLATLFTPAIYALGGCPAITAPALVIVGVLMATSVKDIHWDDLTEAIPAFIISVGITFTGSIANGILLGIIIYPILKLLCGRGTEVKIGLWILSILLIGYLFCSLFIK